MNNLALTIFSAILIRLGATLTTDLWALVLKRAFKIAAPNYSLVGRWLRYMPEGTFRHSNIASAPAKSAECTIGWIAHYMIGIVFAMRFRCIGWHQLAAASNTDPSNALRDRHGPDAVLHYATFFWARIGRIKDAKSHAGKTS